ncbi:hypothetical protein ACS0TY_023758 [Phlomoides rotata]
MLTYILPGWEGSASDARVLRDSISRVHGLKVHVGKYYICDNGYTNSPGFLSSYRSVSKDCATGEAAEEVPEAIGEMGSSNPSPTVNNTQESNDDNGFNVKGTKKIRSSCDQLESKLTNMFGEFCKSSGERLETIARRIGYDHDLGVA